MMPSALKSKSFFIFLFSMHVSACMHDKRENRLTNEEKKKKKEDDERRKIRQMIK